MTEWSAERREDYAAGYEFAWREAIEWFEARLFTADQLPAGSERVVTESQVVDARLAFWRPSSPAPDPDDFANLPILTEREIVRRAFGLDPESDGLEPTG